MNAPTAVDRFVAGGLILALAGLFSGLVVDTPLGTLKPFDVLIMATVGPCLLARGPHQIRLSCGLLMMITFYLICIVPCFFSNDILYSLRRSIQVVILVSFGLVLLNVNFEAINRRHYMAALIVMACIMTVNIGWHVSNGYITDWKRLGDQKSLFVFLPACLAVGMIFKFLPRNRITLLIWVLLFVLILMSGERKALPAFLMISLALFLDLDNIGTLALVICIGFAGLVFGDIILDGYVFRRIDSIFSGPDARNDPLYILQGGIPASVSDAQRNVGIQVATKLFTNEPIFGAGMDATVNYSKTYFANYPKFMHGVAHNEFRRILAEQGLFGMCFIMMPILRTIYCSLLDAVNFFQITGTAAYFRCIIVILAPIFTYMWSEGSGVEMFALVMLVALMPDILPAIAKKSPLLNDKKPLQRLESIEI